jgi:hypothetical protein
VTGRATSFSYLLPIRADQPMIDTAFIDYLAWVSERAELIVIDGSAHDVFVAHDRHWGAFGIHIAPHDRTPNGKVASVMAGVHAATHDRLVIADDDVRFGPEIEQLVALLDDADIVRPQNFFEPLPWHAVWDSGRILINRATGGDWPGTLALRRSTLLAAGRYAGDVLFENYELVKTIEAVGGRHLLALDLFVRRLPPTTRHFLTQRIRQAYDELARPGRVAFFLPIAPLFGTLTAMRRWKLLCRLSVVTAGSVVIAAETGRRRGGARARFPVRCSIVAPLWVAERSFCVWGAVWAWARGGVVYRGRRIRRAALSESTRRRRIDADRRTSLPTKGAPLCDSSAKG